MEERYKNLDVDQIERMLKACLGNDHASQKQLINIYLPFVKGICYRYKSNEQQMEEMVSDCFLKIFQKLQYYDFTKPFLAWLRVLSVNTCIDYYRKNRKINIIEDLEGVDLVDHMPDPISEMSGEKILSYIALLPTSYRLVFTLFVLDGYSHKEIAEMLGIKEGTSKSNLQDARIKLQEMMKYEYPVLYHLYSLKKKAHEI